MTKWKVTLVVDDRRAEEGVDMMESIESNLSYDGFIVEEWIKEEADEQGIL